MAPISTAQHGDAHYWSAVYDKGEHFIQLTDKEKTLLAALAPAPGDRAVDLACGTGSLARYLAELGYEVTGLDFSETAIRRARAETAPGCTATYVCADLAQVPDLAEEGSVDLVVCRLAASFLDGTLLIDRVRHWLSPQGRFVVVVPDPQYLNPARRTVYLDETQLADLSRGWRSVERHRTGQLLVLVLGDWAPSHRAAEKRVPSPNSLFGVGIVVQDPRTGKVLLGHSARFPGLLEAVGGKVETGTVVEDLRHTAARELREETGLLADPADVQLRSVLIDQRGVPRVTVAAYINKFSGQPRATEPDLISAWEWFPVGEPLPGEVFKPTLDVLATCFPESFRADRPARRYDLHRGYTALPAARTAAAPGELSPEDYAASRAATWSSSAVLFTDPRGRILLLQPTYRPSWVLPGGGNELGEYPDGAASREVQEETGLKRAFTTLLTMDTVPHNTVEANPRWAFPGATHTVWDGGELTDEEIAGMRMSRESHAVHLLEPGQLHEHMTPGETRRTLAALRARIDCATAVLRDGYPINPRALERYAALSAPRPAPRPWTWHGDQDVPDGQPLNGCWGWCLGPDGRVLVLLDPQTGLVTLPGGTVEPEEDPSEALGRAAAEQAQLLLGAPVELGYLLDDGDGDGDGAGPVARVAMAALVRRILPSASDPHLGREMVRLWASPHQAQQLLGWGSPGAAQARAASQAAAVDYRLPTPLPSPITEVPREGVVA
ncbi:NUDIX domain-containing protein [Streptacidiphilus sp. MAP5-52]|uniref:NUDIX domain-containing protein n=1 Tax=Streptacidiphilus sp. MAP5-52 TaxID=3156267 RepID=UPI003519021F